MFWHILCMFYGIIYCGFAIYMHIYIYMYIYIWQMVWHILCMFYGIVYFGFALSLSLSLSLYIYIYIYIYGRIYVCDFLKLVSPNLVMKAGFFTFLGPKQPY